MSGLLSRVAAAVASAIIAIAISGAAHAERRVALVIGNSNYNASGISLPNPRNDAQDVAIVLGKLGFEVVTTVDATKRDMDLALQRFARLAADADSALFYYAGHAMQFQGRNYLMPTDAELEDEISIRYQMISMEDVRAALDRVKGVKILILDACRNNPLADRLLRIAGGASRSLATTRGLARIDKTQGMVVAYATAADEVAQDGQGRNSPFTSALLKHLQEPGLEVEMMFRRVAYDVNAQTGGRQRPETYISLLSEYYLNQSDRLVWERIKDQDDVVTLRDFIVKFPASPLAIIARNRLDLLERYAKEREEFARRAREDEQRKAAEVEAQRVARDEAARHEAEARRQAEQLAAQQRLAEEQKRQETLRQQQAEQKRLEDEQKRQQALAQTPEQKRLEDEQKRQQALAQAAGQKRLEDEQKRQQAALAQATEQRRLEDEQKRQQAALAQAAEQKRLEDEQKRQQAGLAQATEQKRLEDEQKRQQAALAQAAEQKRLEDEQKRLALQQQDNQQQHQAALELLPGPPSAATGPNPPAETPAPAAAANSADQIRKAQIELRRVGCFAGRNDGKLTEATQDAVKSYWTYTGHPIVEINVTDEFIDDIHGHEDQVCKPAHQRPEPPAVASRPRPSQSVTREREPPPKREATAPRAPAPREVQRQAPAPTARATASAPAAVHAIGTGF